MAQSKKQLDNLKRGKATRIRSGEEAARKGKNGGKSSGASRRRRKSLEEAASIAAKLPLNDIGVNKLRRAGINIDGLDPDDMVGIMGVVIGQMNAAMNGNSQAAQKFEDWLGMAAENKKKQLEIEKLQAEIEKLREGRGSDDDDQVLQFIEGMKHGSPDAEAD